MKQLNYKEQGNGDPLILIHGLFGNLDNLGLLARQLENQYRVISIDLRNHGLSFHSEDHSYPLLASDVIQLLAHLSISSAHIIGHSMGGLILQKYLEKNTCKKAIFLAGAPPSGLLRLTTKLIFSTSYSLLSALTMDLFLQVNQKEKVKWAFFSDNAPNEDVQYCFDNISISTGQNSGEVTFPVEIVKD